MKGGKKGSSIEKRGIPGKGEGGGDRRGFPSVALKSRLDSRRKDDEG